MKVSIVIFPGSNCDHDVIHLYSRVLGQNVQEIWHKDRDLKRPDIVVLPGGFSYGDYLRTGALAKISPVMDSVRKFAADGGPVIGICNGFQILCEAGLLPGALLQNVQMKFLSQFLHIKVENTSTPFTRGLAKGQVITCPIAHFEGNYFAEPEAVRRMEGEGQVIFRYCSKNGAIDAKNLEWNPNGAMHAIAGVCNEKRNVVGLMPHPERSAEMIVGFVGKESGRGVFASAVS